MRMTDGEMTKILADITILIDTREQKNEHIISYLKENNIPYKLEKLETADYTFILPKYPQLGLDRKFIVEKKNSLDEIVGNFTKDRERFTREFERVGDCKIHLVIENATWKRLLNGTYRSQMPAKSFMASLLTFSIRYCCPVWFVGVDESPVLIYNILKYELLEHLKELRKEDSNGVGKGN